VSGLPCRAFSAGDVAGDAERADDLTLLVTQRQLRGHHPRDGPVLAGFLLDLPHHRAAGRHHLALIPHGGHGVLEREHVEIRLADEVPRREAGSVRRGPADADEQEPAQPVLEIHPLHPYGQQVVHADPLQPVVVVSRAVRRRGDHLSPRRMRARRCPSTRQRRTGCAAATGTGSPPWDIAAGRHR